MMTRSRGICKHGWYCVRLRVPIALRVMSTSVSTCKCKDHIQAQHLKHTMWLPRKEGICHHSRRKNTVNDHRRTQNHCYPCIFSTPHRKVHNINKTCTVYTPPLMTRPGVFMSPASLHSSSSCCPCHRLVFVSQTHFDLVFMFQKVRQSISGSKLEFHVFWGSWKTMGEACLKTRLNHQCVAWTNFTRRSKKTYSNDVYMLLHRELFRGCWWPWHLWLKKSSCPRLRIPFR
jgi:hypothetical protein